MTRLFLIDVHPVVRAGVRTVLGRVDGFEIIGEADHAGEVAHASEGHTPDVVIVDAGLLTADHNGSLKSLLQNWPHARLMALSAVADGDTLEACLKAGAVGYVTKDCGVDELRLAVQTVIGRKVYLSPAATGLLVDRFLNRGPSPSVAHLAQKLTRREQQVVRFVCEGRTSREIARLLTLSIRTIDTHRQQIMDKLGVRSVAELTKYAIRAGLTVLDS